ncbi:hypothetical protein KUCAC02_006335 [Chaenocephalus aceratus]|uniref:Uncharacterized protein n=1 Tax=Chaenocephalus aceratus TaxID=36190 RepID=A0ACB9VRR2_CHAAC|nr:hypothetical protein KUCAC02_006335 [Chaenocephalus aceratus]
MLSPQSTSASIRAQAPGNRPPLVPNQCPLPFSLQNKDPSGLLISVIRTLSSSDDVQDRETEKGRLEEAFETCDRDLDEQIVQHYADLPPPSGPTRASPSASPAPATRSNR